MNEFENGRVLSFYPQDGEFIVLNYRVTVEYRTPFGSLTVPHLYITLPAPLAGTYLLIPVAPQHYLFLR